MTRKERRLLVIRRLAEQRWEPQAVEWTDDDILTDARRRAANAGAEFLGSRVTRRSVGGIVHGMYRSVR